MYRLITNTGVYLCCKRCRRVGSAQLNDGVRGTGDRDCVFIQGVVVMALELYIVLYLKENDFRGDVSDISVNNKHCCLLGLQTLQARSLRSA